MREGGPESLISSFVNYTTNLERPRIPNIETDMSRRYLTVMQRWIPVALEYFQEWPKRPNCGHFFGGVYWYGSETAVPLKVLALTASSMEYNEKITGYSRKEIISVALKALRYLCFTHDTGPEDCVRPNKGWGRPELFGTKWGERGKGFFRESQCGVNVANIVLATLILRKHIDAETWGMVANICADYLKRFGGMPPKSGVYFNTQMEENGWTSLGLAASYLFLSRHKNAKKWEENAKRWMFCTATVPFDMFNGIEIEKERTARQLCSWTFTTLPDLMAENHGFVHPTYTASAIFFLGSVANLYRVCGRKEPKHLYWHRKEIYENLKRLCDFTGTPHPVQGMDWPYITHPCSLHSSAYLYLKDPDAGYFENAALSLLEKVQKGNKGRMIDPEIALKCYDQQDPMIMREIWIGSVADSYLMHRLFAFEEKVKPSTFNEIMKKYGGVKVYPHSGFVFHRHMKGQTSLSWRNHVMALPLTREGLLTLGPSSPRHGPPSILGKVIVSEFPESRKPVLVKVKDKRDGFAAVLINDLFQESVRQKAFFASLPDGRSVSVETFTALKECTIERVEQGYIQITNENFPYLEGNCKGYRTLFYPGGSRIFKGYASENSEDDIIFSLEKPSWVNIDDRVGLIFDGDGETVYCNRHYFRPPKPYQAIADDLILSVKDGASRYREREEIARLSLIFYPEQEHNETKKKRFKEVLSKGDAVAILTDEFLCIGNFGEAGRYSFKFPRGLFIPIFTGLTEILEDKVVYTFMLDTAEGTFYKTRGTLECDCEKLIVERTLNGNLYITNPGNETVAVTIKSEKIKKTFEIRAKETLKIDL